jgi:serine/threonine-protein kinase RsbW
MTTSAIAPLSAVGAASAAASAGPASSARPAPRTPAVGTTADKVAVRIPADGAYLSVTRTATAGLAARLDFTLDEIEDLRIAVDEACAMLLTQAVPGSSLDCEFTLTADAMTITVSVVCVNPRPPSADTFAWTVLSALAGSVEAQAGPADRLAVVMRKTRPGAGLATAGDRD